VKILKTTNNTSNHALFYTFNSYPHIPITLQNNIHKLGDEWCHTVICSLDNEQFIKDICSKISKNINVIVLPIKDITYNELNETLLQPDFWKSIQGNNILLHNENSFILNSNINNTFLGSECLGYTLPIIFMFNKLSNGYSDITFRKKDIILESLENINKIKITNSICQEIKEDLNLENFSEDILYSFYIHNVKNDNLNLEKFKKQIHDFDSNVLVLQYKFENLESKLKLDIKEFVEKNIFNRIIFLENFFSRLIV